MKVEISSIKIKVAKKTLTLTLAEYKALFDELNTIFGPKYNYYGSGSGTTFTLPVTAPTYYGPNGVTTTTKIADGSVFATTSNNLSVIGE